MQGDFPGREIEGRHSTKRVFMHLSARVPWGNTQMCTWTACGCGNSSVAVLSVVWFLLGEHLYPPWLVSWFPLPSYLWAFSLNLFHFDSQSWTVAFWPNTGLLAGVSPADSPQVALSLEALGLRLMAAKSRLPNHLLEALVLRSLFQGLTFRLVKVCGYI